MSDTEASVKVTRKLHASTRRPLPVSVEAPGQVPTISGVAPAPQSTIDEVSASTLTPLRKAAIVLVSLDQSLSSSLLSRLDRSAVDSVTLEIARLERIDPVEQAAVLEEFLGMGLRRLCFTFDDLVRTRDDDIRVAFLPEDLETWALALAGASPPIRAKVLGSLNKSSAGMLRRRLENLGPFRLSDTETAQSHIAERIRLLYDQGSLELPEPSGREEVLV